MLEKKKEVRDKKLGDVDAYLTFNICDVYFNREKQLKDNMIDCLANRYYFEFKDIDESLKEGYIMHLDLISPLSGPETNERLLEIRNAYVREAYSIYWNTHSVERVIDCTRRYYEVYKLVEKQEYVELNNNSIVDSLNDSMSIVKTKKLLNNYNKKIHI